MLITSEMELLGFDEVKTDEVGNIIGIIKGYKSLDDIVLLSNIDLPVVKNNGDNDEEEDPNFFENDKPGIVTSLFTGALFKRSLALLTGDLIVACITRSDCCGFGVKHLFNQQLKTDKIKGVILCEPTDFKINTGSKGRLEYEIVVHDSNHEDNPLGNKQAINTKEINLLNSLNDISDRLPMDNELGKSTLVVKNIHYTNSPSDKKEREMHIQVDRTFMPCESKDGILQNAIRLAKNIYNEKDAVDDTHIDENKITTSSGKILKEVKEYKPWKMEGYHPFVVNSLEVLHENSFTTSVGYWKNMVTAGSFTNGELKIPTIGFGAGKEESTQNITFNDLLKSIYGKSLIIYRQIGVPTFGWDDGEI
jgi:acetylornithine deacetylase/succinyl-diaminopimelate desuccinylase-like protein